LFTTLRYPNRLVPLIILTTIVLTLLLLTLPALTSFFSFSSIPLSLVLVSLATGMVSVTWYELVKARHRYLHRQTT
jgi:Ca2+-transporting ATPase